MPLLVGKQPPLQASVPAVAVLTSQCPPILVLQYLSYPLKGELRHSGSDQEQAQHGVYNIVPLQ